MHWNVRRISLVARLAAAVVLVVFPLTGHALGLGKLKVLSALNEPLNAEIEFSSVTEKELKGLNAVLATHSDFAAAGVERLPYLSHIKFTVAKRLDGRYFLQLRTEQQIDEPFLHLLLQVEWPGGRLVREYTALIDPPHQVAGKPSGIDAPSITPPKPALEPVAPLATEPLSEAPKSPETPLAEVKPPDAKTSGEIKTAEAAPPEATPKEETLAPEAAAPEKPGEEKLAGPPEEPAGPPAPSAQTETETAPKVEPLAAAPREEATPVEPTPETPPAAAPMLDAPAASASWAGASEYSVKPGETLWQIAHQVRTDNQLSVEQVILAIHKTNKDAFFGNNVNNLKAGKILKLPERAEVESVPAAEARKEFRAQYDVWQEYKLRLAASGSAIKVTEEAVAKATADSAATKPEEKAATAPESPKKKEESKPPKTPTETAAKGKQTDELLKIVRNTLQNEKSTPDKKVAKTESPKEAAAQERLALADRVTTLEESLESKRLENKELSEKVGMVRSQLKKESRLIELESQNLAQTQKKAPEPPKPVPVVKPENKPEEKVKTEPLKEPAKPVIAENIAPAPEKVAAPKKKVPLPPPPEEKGLVASLMEAVQSDIVMPLLIGIVVLVSGGIALVYFRRRQKSIAEFEESILSSDAISTELPAADTSEQAVTTGGDTSFLSDFSQGGMGNIHTDEVDPVAEAEVYLAYGRDETAEEILRDAVVKSPDRQELKLKLLEIYHQRNDVPAFETLAEELYAALGGRGGKIWDKVEEMGRKLNPENPMFRGGASAKAPPAAKIGNTTTLASATTLTDTQIEMKPEVAAAPTQYVEPADALDFDLGGTEAKAAEGSAFDLDLGVPDTAMVDSDQGRPGAGRRASDREPPGASSIDMDLGDLGSTAASDDIQWEPQTPAPAAAAGEPAMDASAGGSQPQWDEAATKLDLAKAYIDMGDADGARSILQEVMTEGSEAQKQQAQTLSAQLA